MPEDWIKFVTSLPRTPPQHALSHDACADTIVRLYNRALDLLGDKVTLPDAAFAQFLPSLFDVISTHYLATAVSGCTSLC